MHLKRLPCKCFTCENDLNTFSVSLVLLSLFFSDRTTCKSFQNNAAPSQIIDFFFPFIVGVKLLLYLDSKMRPFNCVFQEDMNLNEDKKTPLREKDFAIKKEMVMQYIHTASKTVSKNRQVDKYCRNV